MAREAMKFIFAWHLIACKKLDTCTLQYSFYVLQCVCNYIVLHILDASRLSYIICSKMIFTTAIKLCFIIQNVLTWKCHCSRIEVF